MHWASALPAASVTRAANAVARPSCISCCARVIVALLGREGNRLVYSSFFAKLGPGVALLAHAAGFTAKLEALHAVTGLHADLGDRQHPVRPHAKVGALQHRLVGLELATVAGASRALAADAGALRLGARGGRAQRQGRRQPAGQPVLERGHFIPQKRKAIRGRVPEIAKLAHWRRTRRLPRPA